MGKAIARLHRGMPDAGGPSLLQSGAMAQKPAKSLSEYDVIEPIGKRVVVRKDDNKRTTRGASRRMRSTS